jgi:prohibitin 1
MLHRPIDEFLPSLHINLGKTYDEKILPSIGNEVLKAVVAQYDADQLLKQRPRISQEIKEQLTVRAKDFNIALDDVSIVHLSFMKEYAQAIEHKQVA